MNKDGHMNWITQTANTPVVGLPAIYSKGRELNCIY